MQARPDPISVFDPPRRVTLRGLSFTVTDDKPTFWDRAVAGSWEPETLGALESLVRPGDAVLDIGAWVGPTALFSAALGAQVVAVEADPRAQVLLAGNVAANPELAARIRIVPRAAMAEAGVVRLGAPRKPGDSMSSVLYAARDNAWEVEAVTPAELLALVSPDSSRLVVKVDIEGGEYALLPALASALPATTVAVLAAFHPRNLGSAGRSRADIDRLTRQAFEALSSFRPCVLEAHHGLGETHAPDIAASRDTTILFERIELSTK